MNGVILIDQISSKLKLTFSASADPCTDDQASTRTSPRLSTPLRVQLHFRATRKSIAHRIYAQRPYKPCSIALQAGTALISCDGSGDT
jgi:hypothetical protein